MKFKRKTICDNIGGCSLARAISREALWGIVENICHNNEANIEDVLEMTEVSDVGLPLSFSSNKSAKSKRKNNQKGNTDKRNNANFSHLMLPVPKYNGTLLEDHVYYIHRHPSLNGALVRIIGVKDYSDSNIFMCARVINYADITMVGTSLEINRNQLREVPSAERAEAHKMVQQDEQFVLQIGKPEDIHLKYWDQRYRLLSRFDHGIKLDSESWFSITPESVAKHVTASCIGRAKGTHCKLESVLDCFSGCGGNTIPFLLQGKNVISVDFDSQKLDNLRHNCEVYGVKQQIEHCVCVDVYALLTAMLPNEVVSQIRRDYKASFEEGEGSPVNPPDIELIDTTSNSNCETEAVMVQSKCNSRSCSAVSSESVGNLTETLSQNQTELNAFPGSDISNISAHVTERCASTDLIILSPPWGGPDYLNAKSYCLYTMLTSGCGLYLTMLAAAVCPNILHLLPVNTSVEQVQYIAEMVGQPYVIEYISINHTPKVMAVYMGPIARNVKHVKRKRATSAVNPDFNDDSTKHMRFEE